MTNANSPKVAEMHTAKTYFDWRWAGFGFGQMEVFLSKDGTIVIDNECMGRDSVRKILHAWADHVADNAVLRDNPEDFAPIS